MQHTIELLLLKISAFSIKDYYKSGELQFEGISTTNSEPLNLEGSAIWYYGNGNISQKAAYINNVNNDSLIEYYDDGAIKSYSFYKDGKLENSQVQYYPDGSIAAKAGYINGELNGQILKYSAPGELGYKAEYENGVLNGEYEYYYSGNRLYIKGTAVNGYNEGICYDYFKDGKVQKVYTINNKKLNGPFVEYAAGQDTVCFGVFENGIPLSYRSKSRGTTNESTFSKEMTFVDGVEEWKTFRDGKLIIESFYKNGKYFGKWKVYTYDGSKLYQINDFSSNEECGEVYKQPYKEEFDPYLFLSRRFGYSKILMDDECASMDIEYFGISREEHPIYHLKPREEAGNAAPKSVKDRNIIRNYIDPSSTEAFKTKNNCTVHDEFKEVFVCTKMVNNLTYKVFLSTNQQTLAKLKESEIPADAEIYFYFQQFENRDYDFNKEKRSDRTLAFSMSKSSKEGFKSERLDYLEVIEVLEHEFWNVSDFSGLSALAAFEKEMKK